jgi:hypothetical protein
MLGLGAIQLISQQAASIQMVKLHGVTVMTIKVQVGSLAAITYQSVHMELLQTQEKFRTGFQMNSNNILHLPSLL